MTTSPSVTVVMPVYNAERYVGAAVASALRSTFTDFELLVLDDGSTDGSLDAVRAAANGDARVRIVQLDHGGVAAARNAGLREARAPLIANLDADDLMFPERLERQVAYMARHPECVALGTRSLNVRDGQGPVGLSGRDFTHEEIDASLLGGNGGALGNDSAMLRRQAALDVGGYTETLHTGEDHDMWLRLAEHGRVANLPDVLSFYRIHGSNASAGPGSRERRLPVTLGNLSRAFARRGITDRSPEKVPRPRDLPRERWCDAAIVRYFSGDRRGALWRVLVAIALDPRAPATRSALSMILSGPVPEWFPLPR